MYTDNKENDYQEFLDRQAEEFEDETEEQATPEDMQRFINKHKNK